MREEECWQQHPAKKKTEWPMWPALSLEHITADKAKIKKEGKMNIT